MPPNMKQWDRLRCSECPSTYFTRAIHLKWQEGGGIVEEPAGYRCAQCQAEIDTATLIARKQVELKKAELKALQEEVDDATPRRTVPSEKDAQRSGAAGVQGQASGGSQKPQDRSPAHAT